MVTQPQVFRSLASTLMLVLQDLWPGGDLSAVPSIEGRLSFTYESQVMPMAYGPMGTLAVPGVSVEYGRATNERGACECPVVVSIARNIGRDSEGGSSIERVQDHIAILVDKIRPLIFGVDNSGTDYEGAKECPIYSFADDAPGIVGIVGAMDWHDEIRGTPAPRETIDGDLSPGGWMRWEAHFTVFYHL